MNSLMEAWRVNEAVCERLLELVPDGAFELKPGKGKTIRSNWTHIISVRRMHVEACSKAAAAVIPKLDWKSATREEILDGLRVSASAVAELLEAGKPGGRWTPELFYGYLAAHEGHHRSQIEAALRGGGHELDDLDMYGLWDWPKFAKSFRGSEG